MALLVSAGYLIKTILIVRLLEPHSSFRSTFYSNILLIKILSSLFIMAFRLAQCGHT